MENRADLHIHTTASDGSFTPEQVVKIAQNSGLKAIALTDHDTIKGYLQISNHIPQDIEIFPAMEIDTMLSETKEEIHILAYFIDPSDIYWKDFFDMTKRLREIRMQKMVKKLRELGIDTLLKEVKEIAGPYAPLCRPHLAEVLLKKNIVKTKTEAFEAYIGDGKPAFVPKQMPETIEMIKLIKEKKALAVLAHPGLIKSPVSLEHILSSNELDGIECFHSKHTPEITSRCLKIAEKHNLLVTGGSDDHGTNNLTGKSILGKFTVPYTLAKNLKEFYRRRIENCS